VTRLERLVGAVLRIGVWTSTASLAAGLALSLVGSTAWIASLLLQLGIVVLLGTPVARVVVSTIEYVAEGDWTFAALTVGVLVELMASAAAALLFNRRL
jgi:uncharacterized membrane protein